MHIASVHNNCNSIWCAAIFLLNRISPNVQQAQCKPNAIHAAMFQPFNQISPLLAATSPTLQSINLKVHPTLEWNLTAPKSQQTVQYSSTQVYLIFLLLTKWPSKKSYHSITNVLCQRVLISAFSARVFHLLIGFHSTDVYSQHIQINTQLDCSQSIFYFAPQENLIAKLAWLLIVWSYDHMIIVQYSSTQVRYHSNECFKEHLSQRTLQSTLQLDITAAHWLQSVIAYQCAMIWECAEMHHTLAISCNNVT